jgi:hypothetical protein
MKNRIVSTILAAVMTISAVSALNTTALYNWGTTDSDAFEGLIKVKGKYEYLDGYTDTLAVYIDYNQENETCIFRCITHAYDKITFSAESIDDITEFESQLAIINDDFNFSYSQNKNTQIYNCTVESNEMTLVDVKKIRETIGNATDNFEFRNDVLLYYSIHSGCMPQYTPTSGSNEIEDFKKAAELFNSFVDENNIKAEVAHYDKYTVFENGTATEADTIRIIPKEELTPLERLELANTMYLRTGIKPDAIVPESDDVMQVGITLDLTTYLNGDANCDQKYSIADSTAILQALGNPDKYGLSDLGLFNADSTGNGLTVEDAVAIKTALAKGL